MGGILGFDALCSSSVTVSESQNSSRRGSTISVQVWVRLLHCVNIRLQKKLKQSGNPQLTQDAFLASDAMARPFRTTIFTPLTSCMNDPTCCP